MLLSLWFDFWNEADWTGAVSPSTTAVVALSDPGAGHGYEQANWEYWEAREAHLMRYRALPDPPPETPQEIVKLVKQHNEVRQQIATPWPTFPQIPNVSNILALGKTLDALALQIKETEAQFEEEAILVLLI